MKKHTDSTHLEELNTQQTDPLQSEEISPPFENGENEPSEKHYPYRCNMCDGNLESKFETLENLNIHIENTH